MERTIDSLTYKGSIPEAINQSRREKKLFVIYISGEDETSSRLEQSTLVDEHVAEVISRCCIFLQLKQGNVDALQFSAICILVHTHLPFDALASFFSAFCLPFGLLGLYSAPPWHSSSSTT